MTINAASEEASAAIKVEERMRAYVRVTDSCQGCGACLLTCPEHAIRPSPGSAADATALLVVRGDLCTGCGECVEVCPADAIEEA